MENTLETWINDNLISVDLDNVWNKTFAHWDCLVDTYAAAAIATATASILRDIAACRKREAKDKGATHVEKQKKIPTESQYFAKVARMVKRSKGRFHLAEYDSAGDCRECGEAGRCPGYHGIHRT